MIEDRCFIIFGDDWGRYPSTIQHIGRVLVRKNKVIWIGSLGLRKPELSLYDVKRIWEKGKAIVGSKKVNPSIHENIVLLNPFVLPFHHIPFIYRGNMNNIRTAIMRILKKGNCHDPIVITSSPVTGRIIGRLGETSSHYFCLDDFTLFEGAFDNLGILEQELLSKVDSCFAISEKLLESRRVHTGHNYFLPQGVDTEHFAPSNDVDPAVRNIKGPVVGFFGLLTTWINIGLIVAAAKRYNDFNFVILGKTTVDISIFNGVSNIHYFGEIPFSKLPSYARCFDVGIIPFVINDLTIACNPLKLLEYLSLDIPVVSTNMPEVAKFKPDVIIANTDNEFIDAIGIAVRGPSRRGDNRRRGVAEKFSWNAITERISTVITQIESEKNKQR